MHLPYIHICIYFNLHISSQAKLITLQFSKEQKAGEVPASQASSLLCFSVCSYPRQYGSQDRIPGQWALGTGHLNKYEPLDYLYFFFQRNFQRKKQDILTRKKVPKPLCTLLPSPWRMVEWEIPGVFASGILPLQDPRVIQGQAGPPWSSWPSAPKSKHLAWERMGFPKPCPWVFQCPNFMLVVTTYKSLLGLFWRQEKK